MSKCQHNDLLKDSDLNPYCVDCGSYDVVLTAPKESEKCLKCGFELIMGHGGLKEWFCTNNPLVCGWYKFDKSEIPGVPPSVKDGPSEVSPDTTENGVVLKEHFDALVRELDECKRFSSQQTTGTLALIADNGKLESQLRLAVEALEYYADENDGARVAREALKSLKGVGK